MHTCTLCPLQCTSYRPHQVGQTVEAGSDSRFDNAGDSGPIPRRLRLIRFPVEMMHRTALVQPLVYMRRG